MLLATVYELGGVDAEQDSQRYPAGVCDKFGSEQRLSLSDRRSIEATLLDVAKGNSGSLQCFLRTRTQRSVGLKRSLCI